MTTCIKQPDMHSCFGCVVAMAAGTTLQDVVGFVGHDASEARYGKGKAGFRIVDMARYLLQHKLALGAMIGDFGGTEMNGQGSIKATVRIKGAPAILVVKSERIPGGLHTVYWDGEVIRDPSPDVADARAMKEYEITEYWVLTKLTEPD